MLYGIVLHIIFRRANKKNPCFGGKARTKNNNQFSIQIIINHYLW